MEVTGGDGYAGGGVGGAHHLRPPGMEDQDHFICFENKHNEVQLLVVGLSIRRETVSLHPPSPLPLPRPFPQALGGQGGGVHIL